MMRGAALKALPFTFAGNGLRKVSMNYKIDQSSLPAYLQLYEQIKAEIIEGIYEYGSKLPSKRLLAEEAGVSVITVEHAYAILCDEGYARSRQRSGYFVIFKRSDGFAVAPPAREEKKQAGPPREAKSDFSIAVLGKVMRKVLADYQEEILGRSPGKGRMELRKALRQYLARNRGIHVEAGQIVIGSGSEHLYGLIVNMLGRDRVIGIESPSYNKIEQVYKSLGVSYELLPLGNDGIETRALAKSCADVLHTTPYRSFPSGVTATASKRHEYISWAQADGRYLIEDDYESEFSVFVKPVETLFDLSKKENVIYMNTFSKTISPSLRVGYMVLPKELTRRFEDRLGFYSCTVPTFEQLVLAELLKGGHFERHINRVRRRMRREKQ